MIQRTISPIGFIRSAFLLGFLFFTSLTCTVGMTVHAQTPAIKTTPSSTQKILSHGKPLRTSPLVGISMHGSPKYPSNFKHFDYVNPHAPKGGTLRLPCVGSFDSLNPFNISGTVASGLAFGTYLYFEPLMRRSNDEPFSLYGYIAASYEMAPDRSWITFTIRDEARWHDGSPITADDVIFSATFFRDHGTANQRLYYSQIDRLVKETQKRVRFSFKKTPQGHIDRELPLIISLLTVIPKAEEHNPALKEVSLKAIMGSGPYKIAKADPGRSLVFERDLHHWAKDIPVCVGLHNFDKIIFEYFRDEKVAFEAFKAGFVDSWTEKDVNHWLTAYNFPRAATGEIVKMNIPNHHEPNLHTLCFNTRRVVFQDIRVRKALSKLFDGAWINKTLFQGALRRSGSFFENSILSSKGRLEPSEVKILSAYQEKIDKSVIEEPFTTEDHKPLRQRKKEALQLLDEAGWMVEKGKVVHKETRNPLTFELLIKDEEELKIGQAYAKSLSEAGIPIRLHLEKSQYNPRRVAYEFDMIFYHYGHSLSPGNEQKFYWSSAAADKAGSRNYPGIKDPVVDDLCHKIARAKSRNDLKKHVHCLDKVLLSGYYVIPLFHLGEDLMAVKRTIGMPPVDADVAMDTKRWWSRELH